MAQLCTSEGFVDEDPAFYKRNLTHSVDWSDTGTASNPRERAYPIGGNEVLGYVQII